MSLVKKLLIPGIIMGILGVFYGLGFTLQYGITSDKLHREEKRTREYHNIFKTDITPALKEANTIINSNKGFWNSIIYFGEIEAAKNYKKEIEAEFSSGLVF